MKLAVLVSILSISSSKKMKPYTPFYARQKRCYEMFESILVPIFIVGKNPMLTFSDFRNHGLLNAGPALV